MSGLGSGAAITVIPTADVSANEVQCRLLLLSKCPFMFVCPGHPPHVSAQSGRSLVLGSRRGEKSSVRGWVPAVEGGGGDSGIGS